MAEAWQFAASGLLTAGGLAALFLRLRSEFDLPETLLTLALLTGATPLLHTLVAGDVGSAALFSTVATMVCTARRLPGTAQAGTLTAVILLLPVMARDQIVAPTLFSARDGFLSLAPMVYVAVIGVLARARHDTAECAALVLALVIWPRWHTALVPAVALLAGGLAAVVSLARRRPMIAAAPLLTGAIVWNYWLMVQYTAGTIPKDAPVSFAAMVRQQADVHTRAPYIYPFAFPGNLLAAWRNGIPLHQYDALSAEPWREHFDLQIDRNADRFLAGGWGAFGSNAAGTFRMVSGRATAIVPLRPTGATYEVAVSAAARGQDGHGRIQIEVGDRVIGSAQVPRGNTTYVRFSVSAADVGGVFRAGYNRIAIVSSGPAPLAVYRLRVAPAS